jgi:hypothetical protein
MDNLSNPESNQEELITPPSSSIYLGLELDKYFDDEESKEIIRNITSDLLNGKDKSRKDNKINVFYVEGNNGKSTLMSKIMKCTDCDHLHIPSGFKSYIVF